MGTLTYQQFLQDIDYLSTKLSQYEFNIKSEGGTKYISFKKEIICAPVTTISDNIDNTPFDINEDKNCLDPNPTEVIISEFNVLYSLAYSGILFLYGLNSL